MRALVLLLLLLLLVGLCAATVQPFAHDLFELYPISDGMIAVFAGGSRIGALTDLNDATHIFTEAELQHPETATPWSMSKTGDTRTVKDAQGNTLAVMSEQSTLVGKLSGAHGVFVVKRADGNEICQMEKESLGDRTILRCKRDKQLLVAVNIDGQGSNHGNPLRASVAFVSGELTDDHRTFLLLAARNIFSYSKNRKVLKIDNFGNWSDLIKAARTYVGKTAAERICSDVCGVLRMIEVMAAQPPSGVHGSLAESETSVRLLVRHLPTFLSQDAFRLFFTHHGADAYQYFDSGKMAGAAILSFRSADKGAAAFQNLSSTELFGKKLQVEFVRRPKRKEFKRREPFPGIAPNLGVDYPSDPTLEYTYPEATPMIVANMSQALLRVPRFYTQVLHLMNKMNLPPPFGPPASYNPQMIKTKRKKQSGATGTAAVLPPAAAGTPAKAQTDDLSSSESELESDSETPTGKKPKAALSSADFEKEMRAAKAQVIQNSTMAPPVTTHSTTSSSGAVAPPHRVAPALATAFGSRTYLTNEELKLRVPIEELRSIHKWTETAPFVKLYIKNLPQEATPKDLEYILGRYFLSDKDLRSQTEIKIMEGKMKGSAFVTFPSLELAQQAQAELNGVMYQGKPLVILFGKR